MRLTDLSRRTVQRVLADMQASGVVVVMGSEPGHTKRYRLAGVTHAVAPRQLDDTPSVPKRRPPRWHLVSPPPASPDVTPGEERRREELIEEPPNPPAGGKSFKSLTKGGGGESGWAIEKRDRFVAHYASHDGCRGRSCEVYRQEVTGRCRCGSTVRATTGRCIKGHEWEPVT